MVAFINMVDLFLISKSMNKNFNLIEKTKHFFPIYLLNYYFKVYIKDKSYNFKTFSKSKALLAQKLMKTNLLSLKWLKIIVFFFNI